MGHHSGDIQTLPAQHAEDRRPVLRKEAASPHAKSMSRCTLTGFSAFAARLETYRAASTEPTCSSMSSLDTIRRSPRAREPQAEQWNRQTELSNDLRLGVGTDADHRCAGLDGHRRELRQAVPVGVRLHHDAELRRRDELTQVSDVVEESRTRDANLHVVLGHGSAAPTALFPTIARAVRDQNLVRKKPRALVTARSLRGLRAWRLRRLRCLGGASPIPRVSAGSAPPSAPSRSGAFGLTGFASSVAGFGFGSAVAAFLSFFFLTTGCSGAGAGAGGAATAGGEPSLQCAQQLHHVKVDLVPSGLHQGDERLRVGQGSAVPRSSCSSDCRGTRRRPSSRGDRLPSSSFASSGCACLRSVSKTDRVLESIDRASRTASLSAEATVPSVTRCAEGVSLSRSVADT